MKKILFLTFCFFTAIILTSCSKEGDGMPEAVGGELPTNFIIITDSAFTPNSLTVVNGSSITFVNHASAARGVYSSDSVVINKPTIAANSFYYFKKDTVGTIVFRMAGKSAVSGAITFTR